MQALTRLVRRRSVAVYRELSTHGKQNTYYYRASPLNDDANKPLALVLGWAGSSDKHVVKYAQMYETLGYHTIRLAPTTALSVFKPHLHKEYAIKLLDLINKHQLEKSPIVVHTFSNAGTFIYRYVSEILHENDGRYAHLRPNIKTIIYDSGPGMPENYLALMNVTAEVINQIVHFKPLAYLISATGLLYWGLKFFILAKRPNFFERNTNALIADKYEIPILAFCSKLDHFVGYENTLRILERRQERVPTVKIDKVVFDDSEHCAHYLQHREIYLDKVKKHLVEAAGLPIYEKL